ncbi:MAG: transglycosylase domain-containing protein [Candidatus Levyibacteriota bacterium]
MKKPQKLKTIIFKQWKIILVATIIFISLYFFVLKDVPSATKLSSLSSSQSSQILDRNDKLLYSIYTDKNQTFIPLSQIPKQVQQATIAIEDRNFYTHGPIDIRGIARAFFSTVFKKQLQGGSTITQQLVKNSLLTPERTLPRKIKEIFLSFITELIYPKDKILEMYLNQIPYGGTVWGVETASRTYFGKSAKDLTLAESALLAGLPESPTTYSPFGSHPELAKTREQEVLKQMQEQGFISKKQLDEALKEPLRFQKVADNIKAPHFVLYVKDLLIKKYGAQIFEKGGLVVKTTLDQSIQDFAQNAIASEVAKLNSSHVTNGASLITNPATGEILAMIGSKDYFDSEIDGNVNVTLALRQPGSSIKPINYAVGLIHGFTAATLFVDQLSCFPNPGHEQYCPVNYDGKWHGAVLMREALGNSINIPAVKMLKLNGVETMTATTSAMGITTLNEPEKYGLSLTLGGGEVSMYDMATAFGVFANQGYRVDLHPILKVTDSKGKVLEEYIPLQSPIFGRKVLPSGVTFIISNILMDNNARAMAFGTNSELKISDKAVPVKTGTTNDFRDNWTIGYTPEHLVVVWVGNNDNSPMGGVVSGVTGAAPIWHEIMAELLKDHIPQQPPKPDSVIGKIVCATSGLLPPPEGTPDRCPTRFEYFIRGTEPNKVAPGRQKVWIDKGTNDLAKTGQTDNVELRDEIIVTDPTGDRYCLTCPHPELSPSPNP